MLSAETPIAQISKRPTSCANCGRPVYWRGEYDDRYRRRYICSECGYKWHWSNGSRDPR